MEVIVTRRTGEDELYHHGIKGQKWGVRRYQNKDGSLTNKGKKRYSDDNSSKTALQKVGKSVGKMVEKRREKSEQRKKSYETTTDLFGVGGAAIRSYSEYHTKKFGKSIMAHVVNTVANNYIEKNGANNYRISRGVGFVRDATVKGLSLSTQIDQINAYANVARSAMYAYNK